MTIVKGAGLIMKAIIGDDVTMSFTFVLFIVSDHIIVIAVQTYQDQIGNLTITCKKFIAILFKDQLGSSLCSI